MLKSQESNVPVVVLTTSKTTTSWVLAVLANTTVAGGDVSAVLASLGEPCRHLREAQLSISMLHSTQKFHPS